MFSLLSLAVAMPSFAQDRSVDIIAHATWVDISGDSAVEGPTTLDDYRTNFDSDLGYGAGINIFWGNRISTEFAASVVQPEVTLSPSNGGINPGLVGNLDMIPITGTLQFHFAPNAGIDPYVGAGVAYILFDDVDNGRDLSNANVRSIDFEDDAGLVLNAGVTFKMGMFGLNADAKYIPLSSAATATFATGPGQDVDVDVNPLMLSAGLRFSF